MARQARHLPLALAALLCCPGCTSPLEQVFSVSGDAPSRTGLVPLGEGAVFGNDAGRVLRLGSEGRVLWKAELVHEVRAAPTLVAGTLVVGTASGDVVGIEASGGASRWRTEAPGPVAGLGSDATRAYVLSDGGELLALDASTGLLVWRSAWASALGLRPGPPAHLWLSMAPAARLLLLAGPGAVVAVATEDGTRRWRTPLHEPTGLLVSEEGVWTVEQSGRVVVLSLETGELRWQRNLGSAPASPPARALDRLWVGLQNGTLVGLRPMEEGPLWTAEVPAPVVAAVAEVQGRLLVPTSGREGRLLALDVGAPGHPPSARIDSPLKTSPLVRAGTIWQLAQDGRVLGFRFRSAAETGR
jgi:outer membrane protein assembly factor BamB